MRELQIQAYLAGGTILARVMERLAPSADSGDDAAFWMLHNIVDAYAVQLSDRLGQMADPDEDPHEGASFVAYCILIDASDATENAVKIADAMLCDNPYDDVYPGDNGWMKRTVDADADWELVL